LKCLASDEIHRPDPEHRAGGKVKGTMAVTILISGRRALAFGRTPCGMHPCVGAAVTPAPGPDPASAWAEAVRETSAHLARLYADLALIDPDPC
jgi:hypothetical protein